MSHSAEDGPFAPAAGAGAPVRIFTDADGTQWRVSERPFADYDRRRGLSLIFASETAVRRVRDYPANWYLLSNEELSALSWNA